MLDLLVKTLLFCFQKLNKILDSLIMAPKLRIRETSTLEPAENVPVKKSTMRSTERLQKWRAQIRGIKAILEELLAKDAEMKRTAYWEKAKMRSEPTERQEKFKQKEREKKRQQLASQKSNQTKSQPNTP